MNDSVGVLKLSSPPNDVNDVLDFVEAQLSQHPDLDDLDRMKFLTALIELGSNVIQHADNGSGVTCPLTLSVEDEQIHAQLSDSSEVGASNWRPAACRRTFLPNLVGGSHSYKLSSTTCTTRESATETSGAFPRNAAVGLPSDNRRRWRPGVEPDGMTDDAPLWLPAAGILDSGISRLFQAFARR